MAELREIGNDDDDIRVLSDKIDDLRAAVVDGVKIGCEGLAALTAELRADREARARFAELELKARTEREKLDAKARAEAAKWWRSQAAIVLAVVVPALGTALATYVAMQP